MYKKAAQLKLRFPSKRGLITTEDLFDLPLRGEVSLDSVAKAVNRLLKETEEESFVDVKSSATEVHELQMEIVKDAIATKKAEIEAKENAQSVRAEKNKLLDLLAKKQDAALESLSEDELKKRLEELG
jgi:hypothetical protein